MSMIELDLTPENAIDPRLFTPPGQRTFGPQPESELLHKRIRVRLGDRPTARNVRKMFQADGKELPAELKVYAGYEIWLIGLSVGVIKEGGWQSVTRLGLRVELPKTPRFVIVGLAPETRMIERGTAGFRCNAALGANGSLALPKAMVAAASAAVPVTLDASASAGISAQAGVNLSFSVLSPAVIAVGKGDSRAEWVVEDAGGPLIGDQELYFSVLTPLVTDEIRMTARVNATIATFDLLPCLLQTPDIHIKAVLQ